jgi:hypothetical protein
MDYFSYLVDHTPVEFCISIFNIIVHIRALIYGSFLIIIHGTFELNIDRPTIGGQISHIPNHNPNLEFLWIFAS